METLEINVSRLCIACSGKGTQDANRSACEACKGSGRISSLIGVGELAKLLKEQEPPQIVSPI